MKRHEIRKKFERLQRSLKRAFKREEDRLNTEISHMEKNEVGEDIQVDRQGWPLEEEIFIETSLVEELEQWKLDEERRAKEKEEREREEKERREREREEQKEMGRIENETFWRERIDDIYQDKYLEGKKKSKSYEDEMDLEMEGEMAIEIEEEQVGDGEVIEERTERIEREIYKPKFLSRHAAKMRKRFPDTEYVAHSLNALVYVDSN